MDVSTLCFNLLWTILVISGSFHACRVANDVLMDESNTCHDSTRALNVIASMGIVIGSFGSIIIVINACLPIIKISKVPVNTGIMDQVVLYSNIGCSLTIYILAIILWIMMLNISDTLKDCGHINEFEGAETIIGIYIWGYLLGCCCTMCLFFYSYAKTKRNDYWN
eukprot:128773_1